MRNSSLGKWNVRRDVCVPASELVTVCMFACVHSQGLNSAFFNCFFTSCKRSCHFVPSIFEPGSGVLSIDRVILILAGYNPPIPTYPSQPDQFANFMLDGMESFEENGTGQLIAIRHPSPLIHPISLPNRPLSIHSEHPTSLVHCSLHVPTRRYAQQMPTAQSILYPIHKH